MINSASKNEIESPSLELTPLIDIVFIVIVFLLITANAPLLKLPVNIPEVIHSSKADLAEPKSMVVSIHKLSPVWGIDHQTYESWDEFERSLLKTLEPDLSVSIATDKAASADNLVKVMSLLNLQQMKDVQIVMNPRK